MITISAIIPLCILIGIGYLMQKTLPRQPKSHQLLCKIGLASCESWTTVLNKFALYLALPALIFSSLVTSGNQARIPIEFILYTALLLIAIILIVALIGRLLNWSPVLTNTYVFGVFFGNVAYIGPPFLSSLYGDIIAPVSIIIAIHVGIAFSVGLILLERSKHTHIDPISIAKKLITNPLLLSVLMGLLVAILHIPLPAPLLHAIQMLGASASPVVLIALGTFIATEWSPHDGLIHACVISAGKLIITPLLFLLVGSLFAASTIRDISILQAAMPVALSNFALAEHYPMDKKITANAIIMSTIAAAVTLGAFASAL